MNQHFTLRNHRSSFIAIFVIALGLISIDLSAQAPSLGAASNFAVFTGVGDLNNTGTTVITGDIGTNVGSVTGFPPGIVNGTIHISNAETAAAATAVSDAYGDLAALTCDTTIGTTLGNGQVLTPRIYCMGAATTLNGNLTLDAQGNPDAQFIFKIDGAFSTSTFSNVTLINGASACNVWWQVNGAFSLGDASDFNGNALVEGAISLLSGSSLVGRALATSGEINLNSNSVEICSFDNQPPTFTPPIPMDTTVSCDNVPPPAPVTATDTCEPVTIVFDETRTNGACPGDYELRRVWTASDNCGNQDSIVQIITVIDTTAPQIMNASQDTTVSCDATIPPFSATTSENCSGTLTSYSESVNTNTSCPVTREITRTFIASDLCGNSDTVTQIVTVIDTSAPTFDQATPADTLISCDSQVPAPANLTATDNCQNETVTFSEDTIAGSCPQNYDLRRVWVASDDCNNEDSVVQIIMVRDTSAPIFDQSTPTDTTINCENIPVAPTLTATDNCGTATVTMSEDTTSQNCPDEYTIRRVWFAEDDCGNIDSVEQFISVIDTITPTFDSPAPADTTVSCDAVPPMQNITASDNCSSPTITMEEDTIAGGCPQEYTLERRWIVSDPCGNSDTLMQTVMVIDDTAPVFDFNPSDTTVDCDATIPDPMPTATDNCGTVTMTAVSSIVMGTCPTVYTISRSWTAEDECGNLTTISQTVTVQDTTAPIITCPADTTIECTVEASTANTGDATAIDGCSTPTVSFQDDTIPGNCAGNYIIERTFTTQDTCGNTNSCLQTITVIDTVAPVFNNMAPADTTIACDAAMPAPATLTATDNCSGATVTYVADTTAGSCPQAYTILRMWTAEDDCGNTRMMSQQIQIVDTVAPVFDNSAPADTTVACDAVPAMATLNATDNCGTVTLTTREDTTAGSCPQEYTLRRVWTAVDECGNVDSLDQTVIVVDTVAPTFDSPAPADTTVECDAVPAMVTLTVTDNCGTVTLTTREDTTAGSCPQEFTLRRVWTAADECGNLDSVEQTVMVIDTTAPVFDINPSDTTVDCDATVPSPSPMATDNCGNVTMTAASSITQGSCPNEFIIDRSWTATDECGNSATITQTVIIQDTTAPVITCPSDVTIECTTAADTTVTGSATATDNCETNVNITYSDDTTAGICAGDYVIARTFVADDSCGNLDSCTQIITVIDTVAPIFDNMAPADTTILCDSDVPAPAPLTATDNCSGATVTYSADTTLGACPQEFTITRLWVATDDCGNSRSVNQEIQIIDTIPPEFDAFPPFDITVSCDMVPPADSSLGAFDNCGSTTETFREDTTSGSCPQEYTLRRVWIAEDECGNIDSLDQTILVIDTVAPVFDSPTPADTTVECDAVPAMATLTATDNCGMVTLTTREDTTVGSCPQEFTLRRVWTAEDECGNVDSIEQTVMVIDTTAPVFDINPSDTIVDCDAAVPSPSPMATDNCGSVTMTANSSIIQGSCPNEFIIDRSWTATDECGNSATITQTVTIQDTTAPVITCPADVTIECTTTADTTVTGSASATDNCETDVNITYSDDTTAGICAGDYVITRTFVADDSCGNLDSCTQTITVIDTVAPVFDNPAPADTTIACDASVPAPAILTATDNCSGAMVTYMADTTAGSCPQEFTIMRMWTAEDSCGNTSMMNQQIQIIDTVAPVFDSLPEPDTTIDCNQPLSTAENLTATDNCGSVTVTLFETFTSGACPQESTRTRIWVAEDECGNSDTVTRVITVQDTFVPVFDSPLPSDTTVNCDAVPPAETLTATDTCGTATITFREDTTAGSCPQEYTLRRVWTAEDECGNIDSVDQIVTVQDTTPPSITCPIDTTIECTVQADVSATGQATATDNCDAGMLTITFSDDTTAGSCNGEYTISRTFVAEDACGNMDSCTQTISVIDTVGPQANKNFGDAADTIIVSCEETIYPDYQLYYGFSGDNGCSNTITEVLLDTIDTLNCARNYLVERMIYSVDECGNGDTIIQIIEDRDFTGPTFDSPPLDTTISCSDTLLPPTSLAVSDNCGTATYTGATDYDTITPWVFSTTSGDGSGMSNGILTLVGSDNYTFENQVTALTSAAKAMTFIFDWDYSTTDGPSFDRFGYTVNGTQTELSDPSGSQNQSGTDSIVLQAGDVMSFYIESTDDIFDDAMVIIDNINIELAPLTCPVVDCYIRRFEAVDDCGNQGYAYQLVTQIDTTAPTFDNPAPADTTISCDATVPAPALLTATDNCGTDTVTFSVDTTAGICAQEMTIRRVWTATDSCGNADSVEQLIMIIDTTPPTISCPADLSIDCSIGADTTNTGLATAIDNCDTTVAITFSDDTVSGPCAGTFFITRTFFAQDDCGNTDSCEQFITVIDTVAPMFMNVPADTTIACNAAIPVPDSMLMASDNCSNFDQTFRQDTTAGTCPQEYTLRRVWTATDSCGNTDSVDQIIMIVDTSAPVFQNMPPPDTTVACDAQVPTAVSITATDSCSGTVTVDFREDTINMTCPSEFTIRRTWTAEDSCGNLDSLQRFIFIVDTVAPQIVMSSPDTTVSCDAAIPDFNASVFENCSSTDQLYTVDTMSGACISEYTLIRKLVVNDQCGNFDSVIQIVTVVDTTAPEILFDEGGGEEGPGLDTINVSCTDTIPSVPSVSAMDNCSDVELTFTVDTISMACVSNYTLRRRWVATDSCANSDTLEQYIFVYDVTGPEFVDVPEDTVIDCGSPIPDPQNLAVTDSCSEATYLGYNDYDTITPWHFTQSSNSGSGMNNDTLMLMGPNGNSGDSQSVAYMAVAKSMTISFTWDYTTFDADGPFYDRFGYSVNGVQTQLTDNNGADNQSGSDTVSLAAGDQFAFYLSAVDDALGEAEVDIYNIEFNLDTLSCPIVDCFIRRFEAEDDCGNLGVAYQLITIQDTSAPVFSQMVSDTTVECDQVPNAPIISATDSCEGQVTVAFNETEFDSVCQGTYKIRRVWTASDTCNNTDSMVQIITVVDTVPPAITLLTGDTIVACDSVLPVFQAFALDNCSGENTSFNEETYDGQCPVIDSIVRTFIASDGCGNADTVTQTILTIDTVAPQFDTPLPPDTTIACDATIPPSPMLMTSDNCSGVDSIAESLDTIPGICENNFTIIRAWTVVDSCGNARVDSQTITVVDTVAPGLGEPSMDTILIYDGNCAKGADAISIAADTVNPITFDEVIDTFMVFGTEQYTPNDTVADNCSSNDSLDLFVWDISYDSSACSSIVTVNFRLYDDCGNYDSLIRSYLFIDTIPPSITWDGTDTVEIECASAMPPFPTVMVVDSCDVTLDTIRMVIDSNCVNQKTIMRSVVATDECGFSDTVSQKIIISDTIPPIFTAMDETVMVECASDEPPYPSTDATDNCGLASIDTTITVTDSSCVNQYTKTRMFVAMDSCGNADTLTQTIIVTDTTAPVITSVPADITIQCDDPVPGDLPQATDNCDNVIITFEDQVTPGSCPQESTITRTFTVSDECGNSTTAQRTIELIDTEVPFLISTPQDMTLNCDETPTVTLPVVEDNCDPNPSITFEDTYREDPSCPQGGRIDRIFTVSDACGNSYELLQQFFFIDTVAPIIDPVHPDLVGLPDGGTIQYQCFAQDPNWELEEFDVDDFEISDNCAEDIVTTFTEVVISQGDCLADGYLARKEYTITADDQCGNITSYHFFVEVIDTISPILSGVPDDITINCNDDYTYPVLGNCTTSSGVFAEDECECANVVESRDTIQGACSNEYSVIVNYVATDNCGNSTSDSYVITVIDDQAPSLMPGNINLLGVPSGAELDVDCENGDFPLWVQNLGENSIIAMDACGAASLVDYDMNAQGYNDCFTAGALGYNEYSWTFTDVCGNLSSYQIKINLVDRTAPEILLNNEVICEADPVVYPEVDDNCGSPMSLEYRDEVVTDECSGQEIIERTWTATDFCGNIGTAVQKIVDEEDLEFEFTHDLLDGIGSGDTATIECTILAEVEPSADWIQLEGGCFGAGKVHDIELTEGTTNDSCVNGVIRLETWTWTVENICGELEEIIVYVKVTDETAPALLDFENEIDLVCGEELPEYIVEDVCDENAVVEEISFELISGDTCQGRVFERRLLTSDGCGNEQEYVQTVNISGDQGPEIIGIPAEAVCDKSELREVEAFDNCAGMDVPVSFSDLFTEACGNGTRTLRVYSATSMCGTESKDSVYIVSDDNSAPDYEIVGEAIEGLSNGSIVEIECNDSTRNLYDIDISADDVLFFDDCDPAPSVEFTSRYQSGRCDVDGYLRARIATWTGVDACGNSTTVRIEFRLVNAVPPEFVSAPQDVTILCDDYEIEEPIVIDDCGSSVELRYEDSAPQSIPEGTLIIRTWTASDGCGNENSIKQRIVYDDGDLSCNIEGPEVVDCNRDDVRLSAEVNGGLGPYNYEWVVTGGVCEIKQGQGTANVLVDVGFSNAQLTLVVTDQFGCVTSCVYDVYCLLGERNEVVLRNRDIMEYHLYQNHPNPFEGVTTVGFSLPKDATATLRVYDAAGRSVILEVEGEYQAGYNEIQLNHSQIPNQGVYYYELSSGEFKGVKRMVIVE